MPDNTKFIVSGTIYNEYNSPLPNAAIKIYEVDLRSEKLLGATATDATGRYTFNFVSELAAPEYKSPDICIKITEAGAIKISGTSPVYFNIQPETTINYRLGNAQVLPINEFDRLKALLSPLLAESKLRFDQLEETDKNKDISFLSSETGESFEAINAMAQAHHLFVATKVTVELFYALLRMGFPSELSSLLELQSDSVIKAVEQAVKGNIISSRFLKTLPNDIKLLNGIAVAQIENGSSENSIKFKTITGTVLNKEEQKIFLETWYDNETAPDKFWDELKKKDKFKTGVALENTKRVLELNTLTAGQPELTVALFKKLETGKGALSSLAALSADDWKKEIANAKVENFPPGIIGKTNKEKIESYASSLEQLHKELYPTAFFAERLKADKASAFANRSDLNKFFTKNPAFDLSGAGIVKALEQADYGGITKKDEIKQAVKTISRLQKLAGNNYVAINALQKKGLHSATAIVNKYGRQQFAKDFATVLGGEDATRETYTKAVSLANRTNAMLIAYKAKYDTPIYVMHSAAEVPEGYHEMFGDGELCDCEHCQSVYSPAAYFVDMMACIRKEGEIDANGNGYVYNKLLERRPDLELITPTCENTNTPLPYIDLVNELLEKNVRRYASNDETVLKTSFQTTATAELLDALPEHKDTTAYAHLKTISEPSAFSSLLPFNDPLEQVKLYTEKLGLKRYELASLLSGTDTSAKYNSPVLAKIWFGASQDAWSVVNGSTPFEVALPGGAIVSDLLNTMKIKYVELLQLLEARFLNPEEVDGRVISIQQTDESGAVLTCDLKMLYLQGINNNWMSKAARFIRLWKITSWDLFDLDRAFSAFDLREFPAVGSFDEQVLLPLYQTDLLKQRFKITTREALALIKDISNKPYRDHSKAGTPLIPSFYQDLLENRGVPDAGETNLHEKIAAALETSVTEITEIGIPIADSDRTTLSQVYRNILLSKKLKLPIAELKSLMGITGSSLSEATEWNAAGILELADDAVIIAASGVMPRAFHALLRSKTGGAQVYEISDEFIDFIKAEKTAFEGIVAIPEDAERGRQTVARIEAFLDQFADKIIWMEGKTAQSDDDNTLQKLIESFIESSNQVVLKAMNATDWIKKLEEVLRFVENYIQTPLVFTTLGFSAEKINWLKKNRELTGTAVLWDKNITTETPGLYEGYRKLFFISRLNKLALYNDVETWTKDFYYNLLREGYRLSDNSLDLSAAKLNLIFANDFIDADKLITWINAAMAIERLNPSEGQLDTLLNNEPNDGAATSLQNLLKSQYSNEEWLTIIKPISDTLREKRRDALVAWLLANNTRWQQPVDIYKHLLIDIEMDACMDTSRLKQAISSVQLFIDRCLMGLEAGLVMSDDFAKQWNQWQKQYRVWEANRKIFLYPENWIEPELRDDKSPFFKELESQLKQNEVTEETAKEALLIYLQKLDNVAKLEMVGLFNDEETGILHVFGRTHNIPHQYFYRTQYKNIWSAWEKVELDIEGDHILPVVWNGRLMLLWGQFTEKQENSGSTKIKKADTAGDMSMESTPAAKYYEMKLAWSEYKNGRWGGKKITAEVQKIENKVLSYLSMGTDVEDGILKIFLYYKAEPFVPTQAGQGEFQEDTREFKKISPVFTYDGQNATPDAASVMRLNESSSTDNKNMSITTSGEDGLKLFPSGFYSSDTNAPTNRLFSEGGYGTAIINRHRLGVTDNKVFYFILGKSYSFIVTKRRTLKSFSSLSGLSPTELMDLSVLEINLGRNKGKPKYQNREISASTFYYSANNLSGVGLGSSGIFEDGYRFYKGDRYSFSIQYHPFVSDFIAIVSHSGIDTLFRLFVQQKATADLFEKLRILPLPPVKKPYPKEEVDFNSSGAYALYNWELFFHIPITIASQLMQNQKFDEARKWLHYIFNPTIAGNEAEGKKRFWITKPFREEMSNPVSLETLLQDPEHAEKLAAQLDYWENHPFNPHAVARFRVSAYMRKTVLLYIDNLIKWGDQLFAKDTIESINEATLLYVLASEILGEKQQLIPPRTRPVTQTFAAIKDSMDAFSNVKVDIETIIPAGNSKADHLRMFYFCLPKNNELLKYWDTIEDRLFKIRNCMNTAGQVRSLALFEPPIDPAMLVRAAAAGLIISDVLDAAVGLPNYRFQVMLQKANELCNDVKNLGSQLLAAIEKKDAETLSLLRSTHDLNMLNIVKRMKELQRDETRESLNGLFDSKKIVEQRYEYYSGRDFMNIWEALYFESSYLGIGIQAASAEAKSLSAVSYQAPDVKLGAPTTAGPTYGGSNIGKSAESAADSLATIGVINNLIGLVTNTMGGYERRMDDWQFQAKSAELELKQIEKQIAAAEIRLAIAEQDIENHNLQMEQSREVDDYMRSKFSSAALYSWMINQLSTVYFQSYQLAYSTAKKAEKSMQHELGIEDVNYIRFGYWDSLKQGLLSGEKLQYDLRVLENAYLDQHEREMEITKHISLNMLNPLAIIELKQRGECSFDIPEVLYDLDFPGHYRRRIKSVSISIPCIAGPYTSVSATLALINNRYRKSPESGSAYAESAPEGDSRFAYNIGRIHSIATSHGQNDSGIFELNFRDERYLPFEGCGAVGKWHLELPTAIKQFDYNTIADVIMHVKYTAKDGGNTLKAVVNDKLREQLSTIEQTLTETGLHVAINIKHDMSQDWHLLKNKGSAEMIIDASRLPYMVQSLDASIQKIIFIARIKNDPAHFEIKIDNGSPVIFIKEGSLPLWKGTSENIRLGTKFKLSITEEDRSNLEELFAVVKYIF